MTTDFRALCAELVDELNGLSAHVESTTPFETVLSGIRAYNRARAALAEPEPEGPTPSYEELRDLAAHCVKGGKSVEWVILQALARWGSSAPQITPQTSDGYHTFAELYEHRHALMLALMHSLPSLSWFSRRHADGELPFGDVQWFIVGVQLPVGPITYHLPIRLWDLARKTGAKELEVGKPWDGHTADEVVSRLVAWASGPALQPADGEAIDPAKEKAAAAAERKLFPWRDRDAALADPEPEGPTVMEIIELADEVDAAGLGQVDLVRKALSRWGCPS